MPHYLEFDGMSVEKAIETACKDLKISKDNLKYDIVSYGSSGIFGLVGVKKAKIKVTAHDLNTGNIKNEENKAKQNELPPAKKEEDDIELKRVKSVDEKIKNKAVETGLEALNKI
ncbi:MAG: Jag N-terminal domain-containing protein, partial [Proteobacteria bacterium]|nr:Jag N-terminal domain-containing protein [Pseudomonadota bacterium]